MKRFILEINENEKNRILSMHNNVRSFLFEQENVSQEGGEKFSNQVMIPTPEDAKTLKGGGGQTAINSLISKATKNKGSADFNSQLVSSYGELYTSFIQGLSKSPYKSKNADIWYLQLTQDSRITFLNQWKAYLETASKKIQKGKQEVKITLIEGNKTSEKVDLPSNVTTPPPPIVILKEFNEIGAGKNVYNDNKSDVTPYMQGEIQKIITGAQEVLNQAKTAGGVVVCTKMAVTASSSRLRNTGEAENITWADLSKKEPKM